MSDDYDSLSPAEREIRDKQDRAREKEEQAGMIDRDSVHPASHICSPALQVDARAGRSGCGRGSGRGGEGKRRRLDRIRATVPKG